MSMNLRCDATFVEDDGWHAAAARYQGFVERHRKSAILYLEMGVGMNTPGIIKYNFWQQAYENPNAVYACVNQGQAWAPRELEGRSLCVEGGYRRSPEVVWIKKQGREVSRPFAYPKTGGGVGRFPLQITKQADLV